MADQIPRDRLAASIVEDLLTLRARCALVGGLAVITHGRARFTKDIDFAVATANDAEAEGIVHGLVRRGYRVGEVLEQRHNGRMATVRLVSGLGGALEPDCDLLFATCGIEPEIVRDARIVPVGQRGVLPVARRPHLVAMKLLSVGPGRPNDLGDLVAMLASASKRELGEVTTLLDLITRRGYARNKDLQAALTMHLAAVGRSRDGLPGG
jgi:hypothetical protein